MKRALIMLVAWGSVLLLGPELWAQYVGPARCRGCHLPQAKSWDEGKMAKAYELLKPGVAAESKREKGLDPKKDYTTDTGCLSCHVTGLGKPGGFENIQKTPRLAGVTCEACHGPGGGYLKPHLMSLQMKDYELADLVAAGLTVPTKAVCETCHNPRSPFHTGRELTAEDIRSLHDHVPLKGRRK
jgi:hypothetical protein